MSAPLSPLGPLDCPDCDGVEGEDRALVHSDTCPATLAMHEMSARDRAWFAAHPGATEYWRPLMAGDLGCSSLDSALVAGITPGKVRVRQLGEGVRARRLPSGLVLRLDTLDGVRVAAMLTRATVLPQGWADAIGGAA